MTLRLRRAAFAVNQSRPTALLGFVSVTLLLVAALSAAAAHAQTNVPGSPQAITQLVHDVWRIEDGLPQNSVRAIVQTREGYLWLGTEEGLVRYNGQNFEIFDKRSVQALRESHSIRVLYEDRRGVLWIGTMGGGLVRYGNGRFESVGAGAGLGGKVVNTIIESAEGELFVGTSDAGLFHGDGEQFAHFTLRQDGNQDFVRALTRDRYGALWVGTRDGLFRINHGRVTSFTKADGLLDNFVMSLAGDDEGAIWVGTESGLCRYKDGVFTDYIVREARFAHPVQSIIEDVDHNVWVGLDGDGIARVRGSRIALFDSRDGLSHDRILALYQDREGSIWIGTEGGGLNRLRSGKFTTYSTDEGLSHDMALAVYGDSQNAIWVGTEGGGLNRLYDGEVKTYTVADGLSSDIITSVYGGEEGQLWIGTFRSGLNRFNGKSFVTYTASDGLPGNGITALSRGPTGRVWVGTDAGVGVFENNQFKSISKDDGLTSDIIMSVHETAGGELWVGTYDAGVNVVKDGVVRAITVDDGLESNTVLTLYEDTDRSMWIGTYGGGLTRIRDGKLTAITTENGLFNDNVYQILEDDRGNLWMSCNKGIFYVPKATLNKFADGETASVRSTAFNKSDGLKSYELNGGFQPAGWKSLDGRLWFPSVRGVVSIDPTSLQPNAVPPPVVVEEVRVDGEAVDRAHQIELSPGRHKVEFDYVGLSFVDADDVQYRYKLDGYETDWNEAGNRRTATYTNLDPGEYTFRVMAANSDLVWSDQVAIVTLRLKPAFYQTNIFWMLCVLALFLTAFLAYGIRVRHLKLRQKELEVEVDRRTKDLRLAKDQLEHQATSLTELYRFKTKFFNNISHELRTPLTLLLGPLENSLTGAYGNMNGLLRSQLEIMLRNGRRLLRLINQLLDLAKLESGRMELRARPGDIAAFTEGIVLSFTGFALERKIDLIFKCDEELEEVYFDPEKVEKILFNLLSNAVKFTPVGGRVDVVVSRRGSGNDMRPDLVEIAVADTGPGIPADELESIFDRYHQVDGTVSTLQEGTGIGLSLARELAALHGGSIRVQSVYGSGATFIVSIPFGSEHLEPGQIADGAASFDDDGMTPHVSMVEMVAADAEEQENRELDYIDARIAADAPVVLVVDDNRDIRSYVRGCLQPDYRVVQAADGIDALKVLEQIIPDIILSDVMMPGMDGYELATRLKADDTYAHIPIVLLTAKASETSKIQGLEMGIDDYMSKPFNARELRARLRNLVRIREQERQLRELNENLERRVQDHLGQILDDRRKYEQELITARDRAEASARLKSTILDNVSHELRTPLTSIMGYAQVLGKELNEEQRDFALSIERSGRRLLETVSSILDLSQLESNSIDVEPTDFSVSEVVEEVLARHRDDAKAKGLDIRVSLPRDAIDLFLDRNKLERVLSHIMGNAVKFTDAGSVEIGVHDRGDNVAFRVRDTGIGIGKSFIPDLFTAFKQESSGFSRSYEGSGLGLAISKRLVDLMFGRIDVDSRSGEGSTFTVTLPKKISVPAAATSDRAPKRSTRLTRPSVDRDTPEGSSV